MLPPLARLVLLALAAQATVLAASQTVSLSNGQLAIGLGPAAGYAFSQITHRPSGVQFIQPPGDKPLDRSPWLLTVRGTDGRPFGLTAANAKGASHEATADSVRVTWRGVGSEACPADLTVTITGRLPRGSAKSHWRIEVEGEAPGVLWQVDFPRVFDVRPPGEEQLCLPWYWGRLWVNPSTQPRRIVLSYPQPASMQFLSYWVTPNAREPAIPSIEGRISETGWAPDRSDAAGLYWAAEDGQVYYKRFVVDTQVAPGRVSWWIEQLPELTEWPIKAGMQRVSYAQPYDVAIGAFTGDWQDAALMYRSWAKKQDWCSRGTADEWPSKCPPAGSEALTKWVPPWFREVGFWAKYYFEPAKVLPEWAAYREWLRVPMASHYYRYNISAFDDNYPEHLPPDPYFVSGIRDAQDLGVRPLPYINGVIWDTDTQSWFRENGSAAALKNEAGGIYPWDIGGEVFAEMCPATEQWRAKVRETACKMILEHGMSGVYLDCLTATAAQPCYDPMHGHPLHGGCWFGQGNRNLMRDLRATVRQQDPEACFFPEEIGELLIDLMDGYLTLDQLRFSAPAGVQTLPVFTAVYHPYTMNFGCDASIDQSPELFAWEMGQMLVWGSVPLNSAAIAPPPKPGDPNSEFLREVVQAYYTVGQRFLQGGDWQRIAVRPPDGKPSRCGLDLVTQPYSLAYEQGPTLKRAWYGPAVMASAWERGADLAVVMVNITDAAQPVELTVLPDNLGLSATTKLVQAWPRPAEVLGAAEGTHRFTMPARTVAIYVLTTDVARASQARELDDTPWDLAYVEQSGELPSVQGPTGSLWACSDGAVANRIGHAGTQATAWWDALGSAGSRFGVQAEVHGPAAEGRGLPRALRDKPFALLRRLPHTVEAGEGECFVFSGDEDHLLCGALGGARLRFVQPGLVVATDVSGTVIRKLSEPVTDTITLPPDRACLVGYAALRGTGGSPADAAADALRSGPPAQRLAALARATAALTEYECSLAGSPHALLPNSPLIRLHRQLQALACAQLGVRFHLEADDDWLTPGVPKVLQTHASCPPDLMADSVVEMVAPGQWQAQAKPIDPMVRSDNPRLAPRHAAQITLSDLTFVERLLPVIAYTRVPAGAHTVTLADVTYLECNRPFEIRKPKSVLTVAAGRTGKSGMVLRNWSPNEVTATVSVDGPPGWALAAGKPTLKLPASTDTPVAVSVSPPAGEKRGSYEVWVRANYTADPASEVKALIPVALLPSLLPVTADAPPQTVPPGNQAHLRRAGKLVLFAEQGEPIKLAISSLQAGNYNATGAYVLRGPDLSPLAQDSIPLNESREISLPAPETGTYYLEVTPGVGQAVVMTENPYVGELATEQDPLNLFCSPVTRHFWVPAGSTGFGLWATDGGPDETARFVVTSPTGRVALDRDGNYSGTHMPIQVRAGEAGKVWTLRVEPRQDVSLWFEGEVCPYLSATTQGVLREAEG